MAIRYDHLLAAVAIFASLAVLPTRWAWAGSAVSNICFFDLDSNSHLNFEVEPTDHPEEYEFNVALQKKPLSDGNYEMDELYDWKKDPDALHSFRAAIQKQVQKSEHCDALVISGNYSRGAFTPKFGTGQLRVTDIASSILQSSKDPIAEKQVQDWAKQVKAIYLDGSKTARALPLLSPLFPNAALLANEKDIPVKAQPVQFNGEQKSHMENLVQAMARPDTLPAAVSNLQQVQNQLETVQGNPLLADPSATVPNFSDLLTGRKVMPMGRVRMQKRTLRRLPIRGLLPDQESRPDRSVRLRRCKDNFVYP